MSMAEYLALQNVRRFSFGRNERPGESHLQKLPFTHLNDFSFCNLNLVPFPSGKGSTMEVFHWDLFKKFKM